MGILTSVRQIETSLAEIRGVEAAPVTRTKASELNIVEKTEGPIPDIIFPSAMSTIGLNDYKDFGSDVITFSAWRP